MKLTNKLSILAIIFTLIATSCGDTETEATFNGVQVHFVSENSSTSYLFDGTAGVQTNDPIAVTLVGMAQPEAITITVEVDAASTAVAGVHYQLNSASVTIPAGSYSGNIDVTGLLDGFGGDPLDRRTLLFTIVDSSAPIAIAANTLTHSIGITCPSAIDGTYSFSSINLLADGGTRGSNAGPVTGSGLLSTSSAGEYTITDASFGLFADLYSDSPAVGPAFTDVCSLIDFDGVTDQYGDTYTITNLTVSADGTSITFDWINTFGDGATTTMTRSDGTTWPLTLTSN